MCQTLILKFQACHHCFLLPRSHPVLPFLAGSHLSKIPDALECRCEGRLKSISFTWDPQQPDLTSWCFHCRLLNIRKHIEIPESWSHEMEERVKSMREFETKHIAKMSELLGQASGKDLTTDASLVLPWYEKYALKRQIPKKDRVPRVVKDRVPREVRFVDQPEMIPDVKTDTEPDVDDQAIIGADTELYQQLAAEQQQPLTRLQLAYWPADKGDSLTTLLHFRSTQQKQHLARDIFSEQSLLFVNGYLPIVEKDCSIVEVADAHVGGLRLIEPGMDHFQSSAY